MRYWAVILMGMATLACRPPTERHYMLEMEDGSSECIMTLNAWGMRDMHWNSGLFSSATCVSFVLPGETRTGPKASERIYRTVCGSFGITPVTSCPKEHE